MRRGASLVAIAALTGAACGGGAFVRPAGPGRAAPEAAALWAEATAPCRAVTAYAATMGLTGVVGDQRIRGLASATLGAAVTAAGQVGLEARVSGQLAFKLGGTALDAMLLIDDRVVRAPAGEILEALIGLRIGPERLLAVLTGCVSTSDRVERGVRHDDLLQVVTPAGTVFLAESRGVWAPRGGEFDGLDVGYPSFRRGFPSEIRLRTQRGREPAVSLSLTVRSYEIDPSLPAGAFSVAIPDPGAVLPMSLEDLRESGPLGASDASR